MSTVLHVNDQNFQSEILESDLPVMVDFHATWCGPCKQLAPIVDELATEYDGRAKFAKIDIDEAPGVASSHGIMAVPTILVFKGGQKVQQLTGFKPKPELKKALDGVV